MTNFSEKIRQEALSIGTIIYKPFVLPGVVSFVVSFVAGTRHDKQHGVTARLLANWAREATREHVREELSELLEGRAISIQVVTDTLRTSVYVTCPSQEIEEAMSITSLICRAPRFETADLELARLRLVTGLRQSLESTAERAEQKVWQKLFPQAHPNYHEPTLESISKLQKLSATELKRYWQENWGANDLVLAATGDVRYAELASMFTKHFSGWESTGLRASPDQSFDRNNADKKIEVVKMPSKASVDVLWAEPISLDVWGREYQALRLALRVLGGHGFSSRLMGIVRDKHGLTYGTYANLAGLFRGDSGAMFVNASFAPALYEKGLGITGKVIADFARAGVTAKELEQMRENLLGSVEVGLSTSSGVLRALLEIAENKRPLSSVDDMLATVRSLKLVELNAAIKKYIHPNKLVTVAAGSI